MPVSTHSRHTVDQNAQQKKAFGIDTSASIAITKHQASQMPHQDVLTATVPYVFTHLTSYSSYLNDRPTPYTRPLTA